MSSQSIVLPDDLFPDIIRYSMEDIVGDLDPSKPPLSYRLVCKLWQHLVDNAPEVWAKLAIRSAQYLPGSPKAIKDWFTRARAGSLNLRLILEPPPASSNVVLLLEIFMSLMEFSPEFEELDLAIPSRFLSTLLNNSSLATLKTLKLSMSEPPSFILHSSATSLENVSLAMPPPTLPFIFSPESFIHQCAQLTCLELNTGLGGIDCIWGLVFQCPGLRVLKVCAEHSIGVPCIPLESRWRWPSNLQQLSISISARPLVIGLFLDGFTLPFLQELNISFQDITLEPDTWPKNAIVALRKRSIAPLKKVTVHGRDISEAELVDFVTKIPTLEKLVVAQDTTNFLTPTVMALLPQTEAQIQGRRMMYDEELEDACRAGLR
jgi:hypothetical protein